MLALCEYSLNYVHMMAEIQDDQEWKARLVTHVCQKKLRNLNNDVIKHEVPAPFIFQSLIHCLKCNKADQEQFQDQLQILSKLWNHKRQIARVKQTYFMS